MKVLRHGAVCAATLALGLASIAAAASPGAAGVATTPDADCVANDRLGVQVCANVDYYADDPAHDPDEEQMLDLYLPLEAGDESLPVVLMIHGGGWKSGDKGRLSQRAAYFTRNGLTVASLNYTLSKGPTPEDPGQPVVPSWPTAFDDVQAASEWIRDHGSEYGMDGTIQGVYGESAGGNLGGLLHTEPDVAHPPVSAVTLSGVMDLELAWVDSATGQTQDEIGQYLGCAPIAGGCPEKGRDASPTTFVSHGDGPMLLFHSRKEFVPVSVAKKMDRKLTDARVEHELVIRKGSLHAGAYACKVEEVGGEEVRVIDAAFTWLADDLLGGGPHIPDGSYECRQPE